MRHARLADGGGPFDDATFQVDVPALRRRELPFADPVAKREAEGVDGIRRKTLHNLFRRRFPDVDAARRVLFQARHVERVSRPVGSPRMGSTRGSGSCANRSSSPLVGIANRAAGDYLPVGVGMLNRVRADFVPAAKRRKSWAMRLGR